MGDVETGRLMDLAMRMFAELGYDSTSIRLIADAAGVPAEQVVARTGGKAQLYQAVIARSQESERDAVDAALESFTPTRQGVIDLVDALLDFYAGHPQFLTLWLHRWVGDAADMPGPEIYVRGLSQRLAEAIRDVVKPDVDLDHLVWTIVWCIFGFLTSGVQPAASSAHPGYRTPGDPRSLAGFRSYLHVLITHLTLPGGATAAS